MSSQNMNSTTYGAYSVPYCHRCGAPGGTMYVGGLPTCAWCVAELNSKNNDYQKTFIPDKITVDAYLEQDPFEIVKVKYLVEDLEPLQYIDGGDWIDLRCAKDTPLYQFKHAMIPLGVAIHLPEGYEAIFAPRSSAFKKWGIIQTNSIGIVDESYCGDNDQWYLSVFCTDDAMIYKNDRVAQFRIFKHQPRLIFKTYEHLGNPDRNGFGSTGHK